MQGDCNSSPCNHRNEIVRVRNLPGVIENRDKEETNEAARKS